MNDVYVRAARDGSELAIRVTSRASRVAVEPPRAGRLLVRVTAPPADGEANAATCKLLAKVLRLPSSSIEISAGHSAREKTVLIHGIEPGELIDRLTPFLAKQDK